MLNTVSEVSKALDEAVNQWRRPALDNYQYLRHRHQEFLKLLRQLDGESRAMFGSI